MTPYVSLQEDVIITLHRLERDNPEILKRTADRYCVKEEETPPYLNELDPYGLYVLDYGKSIGKEWVIKTTAEIIRQQIIVDGDKITVRNLLGSELYSHPTMNFEEYIQNRGSGQNRLRTARFSQPGALQKGDILATGDRLLSPPREGGNGSVLLHLTGGFYGHWIGVPARIPIALLTPEDNAPPELVED